MIRDILISIAITVVVAIGAASASAYVFEYNYMKSFVVVMLIQIVGFYLWNSLLQMIIKFRMEREQTIRIQQYNEQGMEIKCAHCNSLNFIPIKVNEDNQFTCIQCAKDNSVYIDVTVAPKTDVSDRDNKSISTYIKEKADAARKLDK
jgi:phage FluMu protein Com